MHETPMISAVASDDYRRDWQFPLRLRHIWNRWLKAAASLPARAEGSAAVETALVMPLLVGLLLGSWEMSRLAEVFTVLTNAAREGGRQASTGQSTNAQVRQVVLNYLQQAGIPTTHAVVTVADLTAANTDASAATTMDQMQITVTVPFTDVRWTSAVWVTNASTQITGSATWCSVVNQPYPTNVVVPSGF